ncbi:MAG: hypothetical protein KatS3mg016_0422 [Fimbriimonadales bacterium]|nr:MAG: hypothetical protein KatS3mg016_0422 [Fimbriimonadales bacterium]
MQLLSVAPSVHLKLIQRSFAFRARLAYNIGMASKAAVRQNNRTMEAYRQLLLEVSTFFHPDPEVSYRFVADRLSAFYGGATAAITLHQSRQIAFKYVANAPEWAKGLCGVPTEDAYCARTLRTNKVTLIQDVRRDAEFCHFQTVGLGWTRYLGAPIRNNQGQPIGTLCIIDGRHDDVLCEADKELVALLAMRVSTELERERLFEERVAQERRALAERNQQLERTQRTLDAIARALRYSNLLEEETLLAQALAESLKQIREISGVAIVRKQESNHLLRGVFALPHTTRDMPTRLPAWHELWERLESGAATVLPLPSPLARQLGGAWGVACAYRDMQQIAGVIAIACSELPESDAFRAVYLEPILNLVVQIIEGHRLRAHLQRMYEELACMQQQLIQREKLSVVGALAAATAHDIRNIVSSLALSLNLNQDEPHRLLHELKHQLDRLNVLSHRLLSYARPQQLVYEAVHLPTLAQHVLELVASQAQMAQVKTVLEITPRLPKIEADPNQLEHMLVNLVLNGIKAMTPMGGGVLTIRIRRVQRAVCLSVHDTGEGIPEDLLPRLFEPFMSTHRDGFGLGLFSVKRTVDMHHGRIEVHSQRGQGTIFEIYLPIRQPRTGGALYEPSACRR